MKTKLWIVAIAAIIVTGVIFSCTKDLYTTAPQLNFESVNGTRFPRGSQITFKLQVTDKEGDVQDSIWIERISYDSSFCGNDSFVYQMPDFNGTKDLKADINVTYNFGVSVNPYLQGCSEHDDSCYFRFWIHDNAMHTSDTVRSPDVVLLQN